MTTKAEIESTIAKKVQQQKAAANLDEFKRLQNDIDALKAALTETKL